MPGVTTTYSLRSASPAKTRADAVVVAVVSGKDGPELAPGAEDVAEAYGRRLRPLLATLGVTGRAGEVARVPAGDALRTSLLVLVGLGGAVTTDAVRRAAGVAARSVPNASAVALALPADTPELVDAVTQGHLLGGYRFTRYKSSPGEDSRPGDVVVLSPAARTADAKGAFERAQVVATAVAGTRDWVNEPPGDFTPALFADAVTQAHRAATKGRGAPRVELEVLDEEQLVELGAGGILAVGGGSDAPPRLVRLTYRPADAVTHVALVGKGVTYDSGGLTIKPGGSMAEMKADMAGAATVVRATLALAALEVPVAITCLAPMAENMISGRAYRPGDVVTTLSGRTVEVANTDAEGRMILCDALTLAVRAEPDVVVDVATLTGHMQLALGDQVAAVMGSDDVVADVLAAAELTGEPHWPMPIPEEMTERVTTGTVADILQHDWVRWGGGLRAGAFLREFVEGLPWAHLDIAGKEMTGSARGHLTAGATGFSTATVISYVESLAR